MIVGLAPVFAPDDTMLSGTLVPSALVAQSSVTVSAAASGMVQACSPSSLSLPPSTR